MRKRSSWGGPRVNAGRKPAEPTKVVRLPVSIAAVARRMAGRGFRAGDVQAFLDVEARTSAAVPFATGLVACGFPSPADDYLEHPLDFNELMGADAPSVFAVRVGGDSMTGVGIYPGDIAVVNRARPVVHGCVVVACLDGEFTLKTYQLRAGRIILHPENDAYPDIVVAEEAEFEVWGVVTNSIRNF